MSRYLGLDLSLSAPGFAVIEVIDGVPRLLHVSHRKTNAKHTHGQRLADIQAALLEIIGEYYPFEAIIREKGFSRHAATTQTLFKVVGVSDLTFADEGAIVEIPPTTVKKLVTGDGKADKAEVERAVRHRLALPDEYTFAKDDESDAAAVVLAYLIQTGKIAA
jgi:crossover junction endodeoxyribonuclease RuvC